MRRWLEKQEHHVRIVENGKAAVAALANDQFDVALLDVEMPEMDGLQAARVIRARERREGGHVPLIVVTAYAMKGDRERCLRAGFDGYISKPVQVDELYETIDRLTGRAVEIEDPARLSLGASPGSLLVTPTPGGSQDLPPPSTSSMSDGGPISVAPDFEERRSTVVPGMPLFDRTKALERTGGDTELLRELVDVFLEECPRWSADIGEAVAAGDARKLRRAAHTLKGAVDSFGARSVYDAALALEKMARANNLGSAAETHFMLRAHLDGLIAELAEFMRESSPGEPGSPPPRESQGREVTRW
jgi:two-component system sensor histidine kinase/response regulator